MADKLQLIDTKSLLVWGGTYDERQAAVAEVKKRFFDKWPTGRGFTLSEHIGASDRYLKSVRKEFPIKPKLEEQGNKYDMGYDQINGSYLDWTADILKVLVVIPEFDKLYRNQKDYFHQIVGDFLYQQRFLGSRHILRVLMTFAREPHVDLNSIPVLVGGDWRPSWRDIAIISVGT